METETKKKYVKPKCPHNKYKAKCVDCGGGSICEHKKVKNYCKECKGSSICEHNRIKYSCKDCKGSAICEHNKRKRLCIDCNGTGLCIHNKRYDKCKICDLNKYLLTLQRSCLKRAFNNSSKLIKNKCTLDYLGCSIKHFKEFILKKMTTEMNIENIHLDHIKPVSLFNLDDTNEFQKCCHYTNFQPLLIKDNLSKSNKWSETDNKFWQENIIFNDDYKENKKKIIHNIL